MSAFFQHLVYIHQIYNFYVCERVPLLACFWHCQVELLSSKVHKPSIHPKNHFSKKGLPSQEEYQQDEFQVDDNAKAWHVSLLGDVRRRKELLLTLNWNWRGRRWGKFRKGAAKAADLVADWDNLSNCSSQPSSIQWLSSSIILIYLLVYLPLKHVVYPTNDTYFASKSSWQGKVSRKKVAVLLDFVQMRGGEPCPNCLSTLQKLYIFGQFGDLGILISDWRTVSSPSSRKNSNKSWTCYVVL